ncbi:MAG: phosphoribosyl-AMP cyclohydrolase [Spirochaeta sp.]|nr:phosphoribosyl-AMP cyclohydrolase [Spirochaeta sp.]
MNPFELNNTTGAGNAAGGPVGDPAKRPAPDFSKLNGLVAAIAQDAASGEVLMLGFQDREAWEATLATGLAHYYSRSRGRLWKKGESSGNLQRIVEIRLDCDQDAVLMMIEQQGGIACHTGRRSCFFNRVEGTSLVVDETPPAS